METRVGTELIERCLRGDQAAWTELVQRYQRLVYSVALALCPDIGDASDVFQQVWMELFQHLADLRKVEALPAWLITVTRRRAYAAINAKRGATPFDDEMPDSSDRLGVIEREHALERALGQLPERCRRLIDLLYFDIKEPSYAEVAEVMRMPESSVGPTRGRCLDKLRKLIG